MSTGVLLGLRAAGVLWLLACAFAKTALGIEVWLVKKWNDYPSGMDLTVVQVYEKTLGCRLPGGAIVTVPKDVTSFKHVTEELPLWWIQEGQNYAHNDVARMLKGNAASPETLEEEMLHRLAVNRCEHWQQNLMSRGDRLAFAKYLPASLDHWIRGYKQGYISRLRAAAAKQRSS